MKKAGVLSYPLSAQQQLLIRLGRCPGWSVSSLGAHSLCWFCHVVAHILPVVLWTQLPNLSGVPLIASTIQITNPIRPIPSCWTSPVVRSVLSFYLFIVKIVINTHALINAHLPNRAYPENVNFKTFAPSSLKFHTFCDLHETKKCWKFELDILNSFGVILKMYRLYNGMLRIYLGGYKWAIFSYFIPLGYCSK